MVLLYAATEAPRKCKRETRYEGIHCWCTSWLWLRLRGFGGEGLWKMLLGIEIEEWTWGVEERLQIEDEAVAVMAIGMTFDIVQNTKG